ncbi:proteasome activator pa28, REG alpha/beta subunit [Thelephora ganbajun]|uniref:Proteasome activator pa28, REG alpha/beta subunit n=1 Tax=Thelephora ganbajun TaxID=370292 RepID=A0ACB6ZR27_THEGA|nr:proteasome activator pa28, REG alpha/beta subunit [Thelephora ganbajun]
MDKELRNDLESFRASVATEADRIIYHTFPTKILELQKRIDEINTPLSIYNPSRIDAMTDATVYNPNRDSDQLDVKKRKRGLDGEIINGYGVDESAGSGAVYGGHVKTNTHLRTILAELKAEYEELGSLCEKLKLWVNLTMPKIEDGDNFGVAVQEEVTNELQRAQDSVTNLCDVARQHHLARAKISSKILKYPHVDDYAIALREHDERQLYNARRTLRDLRTIYAVLTDIIHKNITKIRFPKGNNAVSLY